LAQAGLLDLIDHHSDFRCQLRVTGQNDGSNRASMFALPWSQKTSWESRDRAKTAIPILRDFAHGGQRTRRLENGACIAGFNAANLIGEGG
jgi:hypothetical protein